MYQQRKHQYQYDESDSVVVETISYWDTISQDHITYSRTERDYENNELKEIRIYAIDIEDGSVELKQKIENKYGQDGLLAEQERARYYNEEEIEKVLFVNEFDPGEPWKDHQDWIQSFFAPLRRVTRIRTDTSELEVFEEFETDSMWYPLGRRERLYDFRGRLTAYYNSYTDFGYDHLQKNRYDHPAGLITESAYYIKGYPAQQWIIRDVVQYRYLLDGANQILQEKRTLVSFDYNGVFESMDTTLIKNYYYCNGLLEKQEYLKGPGRVVLRVLYEYEGQIDCNDPSVHLDIYPNPAHEWVTIRSSILKENDCVITLCTVDGKIIRQIKMTESLEKYELDLAPYGRSMMVIQIQSKNNRAAGKLVKIN